MHLSEKLIVAAAIAALSVTPASAAPMLSAVGNSLLVGLNGSTGNINDGASPLLSAEARFTVTQWEGASIVFRIDLANTSSSAPGDESRITAFGFNVDGDIIPATAVSGAFSKVVLDDTVHAHGLAEALAGPIDVCLKNGSGQGCEAGQGGIAQGQAGTALLTLKFASLPASVALSNFFVRYQGIDTPNGQGLSGAGLATCIDAACADGHRSIPEPTVLALVGIALVGVLYVRRRALR